MPQACIVSDTESTEDIPILYVAHVSQSHYLSLRPKDWQAQLKKKAKDTLCDNNTEKQLIYNVFHVDSIVKVLTQLDYVFSQHVHANISSPELMWCPELVGDLSCGTSPEVDTVESLYPGMEICFQTEESGTGKAPLYPTVFVSPKDTRVFTSITDAGKKDLVVQPVPENNVTLFRLIPKTEELWPGQTVVDSVGTALKSTPAYRLVEQKSQYYTLNEVLAFHCDWPTSAKEWTRRKSASRVPTLKDRKEISAAGCHVISASEPASPRDVLDICVTEQMAKEGVLWCYSFATAEKYLCNKVLTAHHKKTFNLFKLLVNGVLSEQPLPTSVLKSVFYFACENIHKDDWRRQPGMCILIMLQKLLHGLQTKFLPHYFITGANLFSRLSSETLKACSQEVNGLKEQLLVHLYCLMESNRIFETEVGIYFDQMMEDIVSYSSHKNILQTVQKTSEVATKYLFEDLLVRSEFRFAMMVLENFREQYNLYMGCNYSMSEAFTIIVTGIPWGHVFCITLYIDIHTGLTMVEDLFRIWRCKTVDIKTVFGPDLPACISSKPIHILLSPENASVAFPLFFMDVLKQCDLSRYAASALRFYVDKYAELAGDGLVVELESSSDRQKYMQMNGLFRLYRALLEIYEDQGETEKFRPLMNTFVLLVQSLQRPTHFKSLSEAWTLLGDQQEADNALRQSLALTPYSVYTEIMRNLTGSM